MRQNSICRQVILVIKTSKQTKKNPKPKPKIKTTNQPKHTHKPNWTKKKPLKKFNVFNKEEVYGLAFLKWFVGTVDGYDYSLLEVFKI